MKYFTIFFLFWGLKPSLAKCKIVGIGALKEFQMVICVMKCIDLCNEAINILSTYFSYQLAHDVVTTLACGCFFVTTLENAEATLSQHCVFDVVAPTKI